MAPPKPAPPEPVVPPPAVASAPPAPVAGATAARTGRATTRGGPSKKVLLFWAGLVALLGVGAYALTKLKPTLAPTAGQGQEGAAVPVDSAAGALSARGLSLEPEKVVVPLPGTGASAPKPPASETKKPEPKKPEAKKADAKKTDAKKTEKPRPESQIVIEQVPPVVPPVRKGGNQPEYPLEARAAGVEGTVVLFGIIGRDGKIKNARVVRGLSPPLDAAALAAFKTWRFEPATQKGKKVEFKYNAGIEFRINSPAAQVAAPPLVEPAPAAAAPPAASSTAGGAAPLPYGGDFTPPVRTTMVWPQKPEGAQMVKGEVKLQLTVAANGSVTSVEVLEGLPQGVTEAAIEAVRQWKFKPARRNGEPVVVYHRVSLRF